MNCSFCGIALFEGAVRCPSCGSSIARTQEPGQPVQRPATPFSLQQSGKRQAINGHAPLQLPSSKLSSYKPASLSGNNPAPKQTAPNLISLSSGSMPGIAPGSKLSHYSQPSMQPSKLSDYKQPSVQRSKLSDYKTETKSGMGSIRSANYDALASMPTAPGPFTPGTPSPPTGPSFSPSMTPAADHLSGMQPLHPQMVNAGNIVNEANSVHSSSFASMGDGYAPNPMFQAGGPSLPDRRKPKGLLIGSFAVLLLIVCVGAAAFFFLQRTNATKQIESATRTIATPVPTVAPVHGPSGNTSVPAVSLLFSNPQTAAVIDEHDRAGQTTSTFATGKTVYVTFSLNSKDQKGYIWARWYKGKQLFHEVHLAHDPSKTNSYFSIVYDAPTTDGSVELYWSTTDNFNDAKLARVAHFSVTG